MVVPIGHPTVRNLTEEAEQRAKANAPLIALLRAWREDDSEPVAEQREALLQLLRALDEDSFSERSRFLES